MALSLGTALPAIRAITYPTDPYLEAYLLAVIRTTSSTNILRYVPPLDALFFLLER